MVSITTFGPAGQGGDDTSILQTCLTSTAANGQTCDIVAGTYKIDGGTIGRKAITFPSNASMQMESGSSFVQLAPGGAHDVLFYMPNSNVTVTGAGPAVSTIDGSTGFAQTTTEKMQGLDSEYRHCFFVGNPDGTAPVNISISGISCTHSGGDGVYISNAGSQSQPVVVANSSFTAHFRNGISIIKTSGTTISGNHLDFQQNLALVGIADGLDVEPNSPTDCIQNLAINNNTFNNNQMDGLLLALSKLDQTSCPVSITGSGNVANGDGRYGYTASNDEVSLAGNPSGSITISNSSADSSGSWGAAARVWVNNGETLNFTNLTVTNPMAGTGDCGSAAVGICGNGGGSVPTGNVNFTGMTIQSTNGRMAEYFIFSTAGGGPTNTTFSATSLSGATDPNAPTHFP